MAQLFSLAAAARYRKVAVSASQHADQFIARFGAVTLVAKRRLGAGFASVRYRNHSAVGEYAE